MDGSEKGKVKCIECGLLSLRKGTATDAAFYSVSLHVRKNGQGHNQNGYVRAPYCCLNSHLLHEEYAAKPQSHDEQKASAFLDVITEERLCSKFIAWNQSKTPSEHAAMIDAAAAARIAAESHQQDMDRAERQQRDQRDWQANEAERNRDWQERQDAKHFKEQRERDRKQRRFQEVMDRKKEYRSRWWQFWCAIGSAVILALGFAGGKLYERYAPTLLPEARPSAEPSSVPLGK